MIPINSVCNWLMKLHLTFGLPRKFAFLILSQPPPITATFFSIHHHGNRMKGATSRGHQTCQGEGLHSEDMVYVVLCFVVVISSVVWRYMWLFHLYSSGLLHWHWGNHMIAPVPVKWPWRIWIKLIHARTQTGANCVHIFWMHLIFFFGCT